MQFWPILRPLTLTKKRDGYLQLSNVYMEYGDYEGALIVLNDCVERVGEGDVSEEIIQRRQDVEAMAANVSTEPEEAEVEATLNRRWKRQCKRSLHLYSWCAGAAKGYGRSVNSSRNCSTWTGK